MGVTAALVKELRDKTGVGMMKCKEALQETNGDLAAAEVALPERRISQQTPPEVDRVCIGCQFDFYGFHVSASTPRYDCIAL